MNPWIQNYLLTALRIDRAFEVGGQGQVIDTVYVSPSLQSRVAAEPVCPPEELIHHVEELAAALPGQPFSPQRTQFLSKQVQSMVALTQRLAGTPLPLLDEIERCLDITPTWLPESQLDLALTLYDEALPGTGALRQRYLAWYERSTSPNIALSTRMDLIHRILKELRLRTQDVINLPPNETIEVRRVQNQPWGAANWYLGNFHSRLELNADKPMNLFGLLYLLAHEGYPGHHTEFALKEQHLYHEQGYTEQAVFFLSPQLVMAEGIASIALDVVFSREELAAWAIEHIYRPLGISTADVDLAQLYQAAAMSRLDDLGGNVVLLLSDGYTQQQVVDYVVRYTVEPEDQIRKWLQGFQSPLMRIYAFSYAAGKQLLQAWIRKEQGTTNFKRALTEQLYPSLLQGELPH